MPRLIDGIASARRWSTLYGAFFVLLLATEVVIALEMHDKFVRPFVGDALVVMLLYCAVLAAFDLPRRATAVAVFGFACAIELGQYFQLPHRLALDGHPVLRVALGSSFDPADILAYACGTLFVLITERLVRSRGRLPPPGKC